MKDSEKKLVQMLGLSQEQTISIVADLMDQSGESKPSVVRSLKRIISMDREIVTKFLESRGLSKARY